MLDGWYCRSIANMQASEAANTSGTTVSEPPDQHDSQKEYSTDSSSATEPEPEIPEPNYRLAYLSLKKKLKFLIYENECFQDALRGSQKRLLKISRDRSFLLDRLLKYEKHESTTSESEDTESSDDARGYDHADANKRKKVDMAQQNATSGPAANKNTAIKRKRAVVPKKQSNTGLLEKLREATHEARSKSFQPNKHQASASMMSKVSPALNFGLSTDGHMTPEEVERHLQSRQTYLELLPERAPPTVPTEMFSNDPSLERCLESGTSRQLLPRHSYLEMLPERALPSMPSEMFSNDPSLDSESNDVLENSPSVEWFD